MLFTFLDEVSLTVHFTRDAGGTHQHCRVLSIINGQWEAENEQAEEM